MGKWIDKTLWHALKGNAEINSNIVALISKDHKVTYGDLIKKVEALSIGLLKLGIKKGDKVSIWCPNCVEWIVAKFAIASIGAILVPISTRFKSSELAYILEDSDSTTLIIGEKILKTDFAEIIHEIVPGIEDNEFGRLESEAFTEDTFF